MDYQITGGQPLKGSVKISGNKNAILPCMAASLLSTETITLHNVPHIRDVEVMCQILQTIGVTIEKGEQSLVLDASGLKVHTLPENLVKKLRASILLTGALLGKMGQAETHFPGGDVIGKRSIQVHLDGFESLGATVQQDDLDLKISYLASKRPNKSVELFLEEASVTALENILLAAVIGEGQIVLRNCPEEPHIIDLCNLLTEMGASISGIGTDSLTINGVDQLHGAEFTIGDDFIEIGTYAIASVITSGDIKIICDNQTDLQPISIILEKFGINLHEESDGFTVQAKTPIQSVEKIITNIWPGFPTDLMSVVIVLATQASGVTLCHDWMYESRMFFTDKLISMGAQITIADPHRVLVHGPSALKARELETPDIRAGMAMVLAALIASGESTIHRAELIERGYEDIVEKLTSLGAKIKRLEV